MRAFACLLIALVLAGCNHRDGRDGMDGYGVAVGLSHELNRDRQ